MMLIKKNSSLVGSGLFALLSSLIFGLVIPSQYGIAQSWDPAHGDQLHLQQMQQNITYQTRVDQIEQRLYRAMSDPTRDIDSSGVFVIPVVVHIMHLPEDSVPSQFTSNPTDEQIQAGLDWLNDAFANRGPYAGGPFYTNATFQASLLNVNTQIEFCLAKTDPNGNVTKGINRVSTELSNLVYDADCPGSSNADQDVCMRSLSQWDSHDYMNIWLVNSICANGGINCEIRGYSYNAGMHGNLLDGPVIEANYWGTGPSEQAVSILQVGRYLNLLTTFFSPGPGLICENGDCLNSGDRICDTPPDADGSEVFCMDGSTINTCSSDADDHSALNPYTSDVEDIYENFMDGGNMECKNSFTPNQKERMRKILLQERSSLLQSGACKFNYTNVELAEIIAPERIACLEPLTPKVRIVNTGTLPVESLTIHQYLDQGNEVITTWTGDLAAEDSVEIELKEISAMTAGAHRLRVKIALIDGQSEDFETEDNERKRNFFFFTNDHVVSEFPYCIDGEDGKLPSFWRLANLDQQVTFDMYMNPMCTDNGQFAIRYNTSGEWNAGNSHASSQGTHDMMITPRMDLSGVNQASLKFDVAYKAAAPGHDLKLRVGVKDATTGEITYIYQKGRLDLETSQSPYNPNIIGWEPSSCDEWRTEEINLDAFTGKVVFLIFEVELESEYSQNLYLDNICFDGVPECPVPDHIPTTPGEYIADQFCTDDEGWTHYWKSAGANPITTKDLLLLSVKTPTDNGLVLPPGEVKILLTEGYGNGGYDLSNQAPYVANEMGWHVMGRCFWTNPIAQANDSVLVRFYYDNRDIQDLGNSVSTGMSEENMVIYTLEPGLNPDPRLGHEGIEEHQMREYRAGIFPTLRRWVWESHGTFQSTTFAVEKLSSGGGGTGGDGLGSGALYPPKIQNFSGEQSSQQIRLSWTTRMEWGTSEIDIFGSRDGVNYLPISTIEARGYSLQPQDYSIADELPEEGINHYFIQLKHSNGMIVSSDTIDVLFDPAKVVNVFPNPSPDFLRIGLEVDNPELIKFGIYDGQWRKLIQTDWMQISNENHEIDIQALVPGIYFYVVQYKGKDYRGKIVKQRL